MRPEVLDRAFVAPFITLRSSTGKYLGRPRTGIELPGGATSQTITRSDLYQGMHDAAAKRGIEVGYGCRLTGIDESVAECKRASPTARRQRATL